MEIIIIYDADSPGTRLVAQSIGSGFTPGNRVRLADAKAIDKKVLPEIDVLIVGSASHRSRPSKAIKNFLNNLPKKSLQNIAVAAFEIKIKRSFISYFSRRNPSREKRYASNQIDKMLIRKGGIQVLDPELFFFRNSLRPLNMNELLRAKNWGREIESLCPG